MKTKLTKENIAPYLPYGLKMQCQTATNFEEVCDLTGILHSVIKLDGFEYWSDLMDFKPLLFPLSSLTKEITVDGKTFVPTHELGYEKFSGSLGVVEHCEYGENPRIAIDPLDYLWELQWLFKHKFDVFNLIDAGLALPVTENNLYNRTI